MSSTIENITNNNTITNDYTSPKSQNSSEGDTLASTVYSTIHSIIPSLTNNVHKGQAGRIAVLGGSEEYTGAPYFAAISALLTGVDLVQVFCHPLAATPIKSYSPELIVHPLVLDNVSQSLSVFESRALLANVHAILIGPGLGRSDWAMNLARDVAISALTKSIPVILDADALFMFNTFLKDFLPILNVHTPVPNVTKPPVLFLTPNKVEFSRLVKAVSAAEHIPITDLAKAIGNCVTIVQKGPVDVIASSDTTRHCDQQGCPRRCGGQGDVLGGVLVAMMAWNQLADSPITDNTKIAQAASYITRSAAAKAYERYKRATIASHLIEQLPNIIEDIAPAPTS